VLIGGPQRLIGQMADAGELQVNEERNHSFEPYYQGRVSCREWVGFHFIVDLAVSTCVEEKRSGKFIDENISPNNCWTYSGSITLTLLKLDCFSQCRIALTSMAGQT
jgi:hypothetical protein